ncbi:MAG: transposase [Paludibacter sp.]|nr:transposase [Paludibacter sp.]
MQQNKGINKISTISDDEEKNVDTIFHTLSTMKIARIGKFFDSIKRCGVDVSDILILFLLMPFFHLKSVPLLVKSGLTQAQGIDCGNSVFYDLKNNPKINWRSLLYLVVLRFRNLAGKLNPNLPNNIRAFIYDDSLLPKTSHKTELVSRVHDHVSGSFILGYKILVMGYWDGLSFYPLDFSIHREKGGQIDSVKQSLETANNRLKSQRQVFKKLEQRFREAQQILQATKKENKGKQTKAATKQIEQATGKVKRAKQKIKEAESKYAELENKAIELRQELKETRKRYPEYGLTKKQMDEQFKKHRDAQTPGAERAEEADMKKTTSLMNMLKRALKRGFQADYVLTDSWFCNLELIKLVTSLHKKHNINLLTMARMGATKYKLTSNNQFYNAQELLIKFERKAISARSHKSKYIKVPVTYGDIRINLFFVKMGKCNSWKLLITTDLTMGFQKLMDVYQIRWSIEIFFRESKQYLNLGKSKSTSFDAQIADATICLVQYTILSFHQRISNYGSFDGVFASALEDAMQDSIASELQKLFWVILEMFCNYTGVDIIEFTGSIFRDENAYIKLQQFNPVLFDNLQKQRAA